MPEYDQLKANFQAGFTEYFFGKPAAITEAIIKLVDAENPPLHLFLGKKGIPGLKRCIKAVLLSGRSGMMWQWLHMDIDMEYNHYWQMVLAWLHLLFLSANSSGC